MDQDNDVIHGSDDLRSCTSPCIGDKNGSSGAEEIIDLVDFIDEQAGRDLPGESDMREIISETVERITREMFPAIAERIIREEIEKLKHDL